MGATPDFVYARAIREAWAAAACVTGADGVAARQVVESARGAAARRWYAGLRHGDSATNRAVEKRYDEISVEIFRDQVDVCEHEESE